MFAVIFKAELNQIDETYGSFANQLRELAKYKYGCTEFISLTENNKQIAISYWNSLEDIKAWKNDKTHLKAQELGKSQWYSHYEIQIVEIKHQYSKSA